MKIISTTIYLKKSIELLENKLFKMVLQFTLAYAIIKEKQGHNRIFKMNHISLGGTGETYFKFQPIVPIERKAKRYDILCSCCNKEVATRNRLTANLLYRYSSGCCNKDLVAYDNVEKKYIKKTDL